MRAGFFRWLGPWSPGSLCRGRCEMERLPRYSGTAGIISAFLLLLFLILGFVVPGTGATFADPVRTLTFIAQNRWEWRIANLLTALVAGLAVVFTAGLRNRLREPAPTRAMLVLYTALIGLGGYALASFILWKGGNAMASYLAKDQVAATHAWLALHFAARGAVAVGNAFVGVALILAGWAIAETGAITRSAARLGIVTGLMTRAALVPLGRWIELVPAVLTIARRAGM